MQGDVPPTLSAGRGRVLDAGYLQAWGIVGTHSSRKPPRHRNNSIPRPAGRRCPSRRCIDITCPNVPKPGPEDTLWKTRNGTPRGGRRLSRHQSTTVTVTGTRESHGGCVNRAHTRPPDLARFHQPLCCLMASESFGCHDISRHRWGASARRERDGRAAASACWRGLARSVWWLTASSGRTARGVGCYWTRVGCTSGRWGPRAVRTTLVQWIPTLVEQANSRRDSRRSRRRVIASRPQHRRRSEVGRADL